MKIKKKKKLQFCEYRILKRDGMYSIIKVYLNKSREIVGYSDYIIPVAENPMALKILLSNMLTSTRKYILHDEDLNIKKK
jgi:hypothetical protein